MRCQRAIIVSLLFQQGGHVLPPVAGLHRNVLVFDFRSLYPSLIRTFNIDPLSLVAIRVGAVLLISGLAVYFLNQERSRNPLFSSLKGVPIVVPIILLLLLFWTFILGRTTFGRHIYAVGGSKEAARRAGINVDRIRIAAFMISSSMAAIGGIVAVSRGRSVDPNTGGANILLYAVGAAVIGGCSRRAG